MVEKIGLNNLEDMGKVKDRAKAIFKEIDTDGNGQIDVAEMGQAMKILGVTLTNTELSTMMTEADADGDMLIDCDEFVDLCCEEVKRYKRVTTSFCTVS